MPIKTRSVFGLVTVLGLNALGAILPACGGTAVVSTDAAGGATAGAAPCPLPATALLPPVCVSCIETDCPAVYAELCAANCGAAELGAPCLHAQSEIGTCLQSHCQRECMATHGSAVAGSGP